MRRIFGKPCWKNQSNTSILGKNSLKTNGKNKEKYHNIQLPMLVDLETNPSLSLITPWPYGQYASNIIFQKPLWGKIDDIAYIFVLALPHQKLYMRNLKGKTHIKKRVQCMLCPNIIHQKPHEKNGWYDMTLCWYWLIKNFIWEIPKEKLIEKKSAIWCLQQATV